MVKQEPRTTQLKPGIIFEATETGKLLLLEDLLNATNVNAIHLANGTLLQVATKHGQLSIIKLLFRCGAMLDVRDGEGWTPLHRAAFRG